MEVFLVEGDSTWPPRRHGKPIGQMIWRRAAKERNLKRYKCQWCNCSYGRKEHLTRHEKNIHGTDAGPFICNFCQRTYKNAESLRSHQYQSHNPARVKSDSAGASTSSNLEQM